MKKEIKRVGNSKGITFSAEERRIYELEAGDIVDIEIVKVSDKTHTVKKEVE